MTVRAFPFTSSDHLKDLRILLGSDSKKSPTRFLSIPKHPNCCTHFLKSSICLSVILQESDSYNTRARIL